LASERQIAANRRNARASTGPRSVAGRASSAMNATRHGLNARASSGPAANSLPGDETQALAREIERAFPGRWDEAIAVAEARRRLERVRSLKLAALETALSKASPRGDASATAVSPEADADADAEAEAQAFVRCLRDWQTLDGYERRFTSSLRRAISQLFGEADAAWGQHHNHIGVARGWGQAEAHA